MSVGQDKKELVSTLIAFPTGGHGFAPRVDDGSLLEKGRRWGRNTLRVLDRRIMISSKRPNLRRQGINDATSQESTDTLSPDSHRESGFSFFIISLTLTKCPKIDKTYMKLHLDKELLHSYKPHPPQRGNTNAHY